LARLRTISQQDGQLMAAVQATRALLEPPAEASHGGTARAAAGLVIVIGAPQPAVQVIDAVPVQKTPAASDADDR
jgi:hypothetical protein